MEKKTYIESYDISKLEKRFNRSNLCFKYKLHSVEQIINVNMQPAISLVLSPSGYDDPKCFVDGEFHPSKVRESSKFAVEITDFEVAGKLTKSQKRELLKLMYEKEPYSEKYFSDYRKFHKKKIDTEFQTRINYIERLRSEFIRKKGEKFYNNLLLSIKKEYEATIRENQYVFTKWEYEKNDF